METISVIEIANKLGIGENAAYDLIKTSGFPSIPIGNRFIVPRTAFEIWFANPTMIVDYKRVQNERI